MPRFSYKYGLIGEQLSLKKNIEFNVNSDGIIQNLYYEQCNKKLILSDHENNFLLIPGLINSHVHIGDSFAKEAGFNRDLDSVVAPPGGIKHKLLEATSNQLKEQGIQNAIEDMISRGITCFVDFREREMDGIEVLKTAKRDFQIKTVILGRFQKTEQIQSVFREADGIGLVSYRHISQKDKKELRKYHTELKKIIAVHCAEKERRKKLINELFADDLVDVIVHGTQFQGKDLERIKKKNKSLVLCPRSNSYFQMGFPPIIEIQKRKVQISLGTDNIMAVSPDLFEEMRYLYLISRALTKGTDIKSLTAKDLLKMVTINAAENFKLNKKQGYIENGKKGNFFLVNLNDPNYFVYQLNKKNIYSIIVQRTTAENIKKVYIHGELVFERG
ncbi:MAG: amidohydrolase family protein [Promethearchaeia archaeon]